MIPILYEDGEALVVDKHAGLPIDRPRAGGPSLADHLDDLRLGFQREPTPVHRLDTDTSGCLLLARDPKALVRFARAFEERATINANVVTELDKATEPWGVKVLRYEIRNINPPADVLQAMEKQMRAEREKRAVILNSEGARDAAINNAEGEKQQVIKASEARRQQQINEAQGQAEAILAVAHATAEGIRQVAEAIRQPGGLEATQLRVAEQYVGQFGNLAQKSNTLILPANVADVASMVSVAMRVFQTDTKK